MAILKLQQQNIALTTQYTEYSVVIPPRVNQVTLQLRAQSANLFWYTLPTNGSVPGTSANLPQSPNAYGTIPSGSSKTIPGLIGGQTVYVQADTASQVLEVDYYGDT
jgi:hypothetical protein